MKSTNFIRLIFIFFILIPGSFGLSQDKTFQIHVEYQEGIYGERWIKELLRIEYPDSSSAMTALFGLRDKYYKSGYLAAGFDHLVFRDKELTTVFKPGEKYEWGKITLPGELPNEINRIPRTIKNLDGRILRASYADLVRHKMISLYEDNGYPFVSVYFDSVVFSDNSFNASLIVDEGPGVTIDSIISRTKDVVSGKVLEQIIRIKKGQAYSEKKIRIANENLENSELISLIAPIEVGFVEDKAWLYLSPQKKRSNSFDGIIGLAPGSSATERMAVTGSLDLVLNNTLRQAESFEIFWKAPGDQNQRLKAGIEFPWLLGWPIGLSADFELYKKDSSYLNTNGRLAILAALSLNNSLGFYYRQKASNILLNKPSNNLSGYNINLYGVNWNFEKLTNPVNPTNGLTVETEIGIGRKIVENQEHGDEEPMYFESKILADFYIPMSSRLVLNVGFSGAHFNSKNSFENEKFKLGGIYSLRGFDEESIFADTYLIGTAELRYLFTRNSNFHLFLDGGKWWSMINQIDESDIPVGAGFGLSLQTNAGIIMLDYALGRSGEMPFSLRNGKIHLGIKSIF